jgi:hypothetical protein
MDMKSFAAIALSASLWAAAAVPALGCERPSAPSSIPDGKTAAKEDMLAAKKAIDAYKSSVEEYLACEKSSARKDAAAAELVKLADRFNAEVKEFKSKG